MSKIIPTAHLPLRYEVQVAVRARWDRLDQDNNVVGIWVSKEKSLADKQGSPLQHRCEKHAISTVYLNITALPHLEGQMNSIP